MCVCVSDRPLNVATHAYKEYLQYKIKSTINRLNISSHCRISHVCLYYPTAGHHHNVQILISNSMEGRRLSWNQLLLVVPSTGASFDIYDRPMTDINVVASVCASNLRITSLMFAGLKERLLQRRETDSNVAV